ncbi:MAG: hypothetical protein AB7Q97_01105 [Gammaproteobacteria bacterium]
MHLLVLIAGIGLALFLLLRRPPAAPVARPTAAGETPVDTALAPAAAPLSRTVAFVAKGKVFCGGPGRPVGEVHSPHVQAVADRLERSRALHGWKEGTTFGVRAYGRERGAATDAAPLQATAVQFVEPQRLLYFLRDASTGGLFELNLADGVERRLLHRQNLLLDDLRVDMARGRLLASQATAQGAANIVAMSLEGDDARELTGGDTVDAAPAFVPGKPGMVLFQSSGIARSPQGHVLALGPASIQLLDQERAELSSVVEHAHFDCLQPRVDTAGNLLYIRRPYEPGRYRPADLLADAAMFPFRLIRAVFHYLNFFSLMYSRKPLTSASGAPYEADLKDILLKGRRIDAHRALRRRALVGGVPSLVPASWQLVSRDERGGERVLASHVVGFDIAADGTVLFSNGNGVFAIDAGGVQVVLRDRLVGEIAAI